jgi:hypothetical protein
VTQLVKKFPTFMETEVSSSWSTRKTGAVRSSKTFLSVYKTTQHHSLEDHNHRIHGSLPPYLVLSQLISIHTLTHYTDKVSKIYFCFVFPCKLRRCLQSGVLPLGFPTKTVYAFSSRHLHFIRISLQADPHWLDLLTRNWNCGGWEYSRIFLELR